MSTFAIKIAAKLHKKPDISLIICTHNRASTLDQSLAFYQAIDSAVAYEILVVINGCTDHTLEVLEEHKSNLPQLRWIEESALGHSNARNAGWKNALAPFVFYMDDDAYPQADLVSRLHSLIASNSISCISGATKYWDLNSPGWITPAMVEVPLFRKDFGLMPERGYINGCACGFKVSALEAAGGFNPEVGMKGKSLGYYDEIYMQEKLQEMGHPIHFAPELIVFHQSHIKTTDGFLLSAFHKGKSRQKVKGSSKLSSLSGFLLSGLKGLLLLFPRMFALQSQQAIIQSFNKPMIYLGQLMG